MSVEIISSPPQYLAQFREIDGNKIWCIGNLHEHAGDLCTVFQDALVDGGVLYPQDTLHTRLRNLRGNFACIVQDSEGRVFAAVDKIRSYPIFYAMHGDTLLVGTDPYAIKERLTHTTKNREAFLEFKMAGYATGGETLFNEIRQLQAGEFLVWNGTVLAVQDYYKFYNQPSSQKFPEDLVQELHQVTRRIFQGMIKRLDGRPAWVPLSGGLDSRLVLCMLKELGYNNIQTFSYGMPSNCEAAAAKVIAEQVGVPWFFVPYARKVGRRVFYTKEREEYFRFAHALSGIPMMTDFYALYELSAQNRIPKDAVMINGQTGDFISGEHIPRALDQNEISKDALLDAIIKKHYSLWTNLKTMNNVQKIKQRIMRVIQNIPDNMSQEEAMKLHELWEWRSRQTQHVISGQRAYDFFGLSWELPLWDDEYLNFWCQIPFEHKFRQALYRAYLEQYDFFGVFSKKFKRYTPPRWAHWLENIFIMFGSRSEEYRRKYLKYWQKYAYFYAKDSYRTYRQYARFHRNPSSVLAKDVLEEEYQESIS